MTDRKLSFVLAVMAESIVRDIQDGRRIAGQVVAAAGEILDDDIPEPDPEEDGLAGLSNDWVRVSYSSERHTVERPDWIKAVYTRWGISI